MRTADIVAWHCCIAGSWAHFPLMIQRRDPAVPRRGANGQAGQTYPFATTLWAVDVSRPDRHHRRARRVVKAVKAVRLAMP